MSRTSIRRVAPSYVEPRIEIEVDLHWFRLVRIDGPNNPAKRFNANEPRLGKSSNRLRS